MMDTRFRSPLGEIIDHVKMEFLRGLILEQSDSYWNDPTGTGTASVSQWIHGRELTLILCLKEPYGFVVTHVLLGDQTLVAVTGQDWTETTDVLLGGTPWTVPVAFFVSRQLAWEIAKEFCMTGKRHEGVRWINLEENWP